MLSNSYTVDDDGTNDDDDDDVGRYIIGPRLDNQVVTLMMMSVMLMTFMIHPGLVGKW